jgi:hypothetical protein
MVKRERLHPLLVAYRVLANIWFILTVNLGMAVMIIRRVSEEKVDLTMSWATMAMDQVIIAAGWVLVTIGVKHRREDRAQLARIERKLDALLNALEVAPCSPKP